MRLRGFRGVCLALGLVAIVVGFMAHGLGISASRGLSTGKALLIALGCVLVLIEILGRRVIEFYKGSAIVLLNAAVLLGLMEGALFLGSVVSRVSGDGGRAGAVNPDLKYVDTGREKLPYFEQQSWGRKYWREYHAAWDDRVQAYHPFVLWRIKPFEGETLNVDEEGLRVTPGAECTAEAYTVFTFGGSTMWGTGVPDWGTIPAILQADLSRKLKRPVCVINYAEQGWMSTQNVIQLVLLLQSGRIPDVAIFYDGINDVFAAYQSGVPGAHHGLAHIAAQLEDREEVPPLQALVSSTRTYKFLQNLTLGDRYKERPAFERRGVSAGDLANGITRVYLGNYQVTQALASQYGFRALFFWQTALQMTAKPLTLEESSIRAVADGVYPALVELYGQVNQGVLTASRRSENMIYLGDVFNDRREFTFIDPFHLTIEGNRVVANRMMAIALSRNQE